ncbi:protein translocase subunit SecD [Patescibacteria group bacterium]
MKEKRYFIIGLFVFLFLIFLNFPSQLPLKFSIFGRQVEQTITKPAFDIGLGPVSLKSDYQIKRGLDLAGGAHLVFKAKMEDVAEDQRGAALESAKNIIQRRVDLFGLAEPSVQTSQVGDQYRVVVELAGIDDVSQAIDLIGQTAQLDFRLINEATDAAVPFQETGLTGRFLKKATPVYDPETGQPVIGLSFSPEGQDLFGQITTDYVGQRLAIFLDEVVLMAPLINEPITTGDARITGDFSSKEAKRLAAQLNGGALPVPFEVIEQRSVGPTLGEESISKSLRAGLVGLVMVIIFMIAYYGWWGFWADWGLISYGLLTLTLYKLLGVTITLPGLAGFILSVGMAVDSNILVFERAREELRKGQPRTIAITLGFGRAWDSIRDANICTLIICFILYNPFDWAFLNNSGLVRGFALTLALGVFLSMFTGIIVTKTLIKLFSREK